MEKRGKLDFNVMVILILIAVILVSLFVTVHLFYNLEINANIDSKSNFSSLDMIKDAIAHKRGLNNPQDCRDKCSAKGLKRCFNNSFRVCGNYDMDSCYEWSSLVECVSGKTCYMGRCINSSDNISNSIIMDRKKYENYWFDGINTTFIKKFEISKTKGRNTWADLIRGSSENIEVIYSSLDLEGSTDSFNKTNHYLRVKGNNGSKVLVGKGGENLYDSSDNLIKKRIFFLYSIELINGTSLLNKSTSGPAAIMDINYNKDNVPIGFSLYFFDDGKNLEDRFTKNLEPIDYGPEPPNLSKKRDSFNYSVLDDVNVTYGDCDISVNEAGFVPSLTVPDYPVFFWAKKRNFDENIFFLVSKNNKSILPKLNKEDRYHYSKKVLFSDKEDYSIEFCEGDSEDVCCISTNRTLEVRDIEPNSLYPEHNDKDADRINIILIGSGYKSINQFRKLSREVLAFDGNFDIIKYNITRKNLETGDKKIFPNDDYETGFFATEPIKSNKDKFNVWYLNKQINGSFDDLLKKVRSRGRNYFKFFGLDHIYPAFIVNGSFKEKDSYKGNKKRSHAHFPSFTGKKRINKDSIKFGVSLISLPVKEINSINKTYYNEEVEANFRQTISLNEEIITTEEDYSIFTHESGHALFGLYDEYYKKGEEKNLGYPQCAPNLSIARKWWGDLEGNVDPFYYRYKNFMEKQGESIPFVERDMEVYYVYGGCGGTPYAEKGVIRPSKMSIMKHHRKSPIFGSVNRRRVEKVLNLFSGE